mgnify:CR=1 FL=1
MDSYHSLQPIRQALMGASLALLSIAVPIMAVQIDPTDKYAEHKVDFHANEKHTEAEFDAEHDAKLNDWHTRHQDKLLDFYCDTHPDAPECKVYDD